MQGRSRSTEAEKMCVHGGVVARVRVRGQRVN